MTAYSIYRDDELVALLQKDDQQAFKTIFDRYWGALFAQALKKLGNAQEAEDLVQQLFIEVWERRSRIQITRSLNHWLAAAVKFKVLTVYSSRYRRMHTSSEIDEELPADTPLPDSIIELQEMMATLEAMIEALPERPRMVFRMSRDLQLSNKEIAEQLDISEKTVENHMNRALGSLRKSLGDSAMSVFLLLF